VSATRAPAIQPAAPQPPPSRPPAAPLAPWRQTVRMFSRPVPLLHSLYPDGGDVAELAFTSSRRIVLTRDAADVKRIFTAPPDDVPSATARSPLAPLVGPHSVLTLIGPEHLRQRRLLLPAFHGDRLTAYRPVMARAAEEELATWRPGERIATQPRMQAITLEVILRAVFGVEDGARRDALRRTIRALLGRSDSALGAVMTVVAGRTGRIVGPGRRLVAALDHVIHAEIAEHRGRGDVEQRDDILSLLMQARDEDGEPMGDAELRDELVTLLLAGHETTATALAWSLHELGRDPAQLRRAREAARAGDDDHLEAVLKEAMRLHPVIPMVVRTLMRPATVGDWKLPAGTTVGPSILVAHSREDNHPHADRFDPSRFLGGHPPVNTWIPFGGGVRRCIGAGFALMEGTAVLRAILTSYDVTAVGADRPRVRNITSVPRHGSRIRVS
jgi:cytochrome P450 family 135